MRHSILLAAGLAALANLFWAANAIVGKAAVASMPAFTLSQFRWLLAFAIIAPFGIPKVIAQWSWYKANFKALVILSFLSVGIYNTFQYWALEYTQPVKVGAMLALMPLAIAIASSLMGGLKPTLIQWFTTAIAVFGAVTVVTNGQFNSLMSGDGAGMGELLMVVAISGWAVYSVLLKRLPNAGVSMVGMVTFFIGIGSLLISPFWLIDVMTEPVFVPTGKLWWPVLFVAIFPSIVAYFAWNSAIRIGDATIAGLMVTSAPLFNAMLSMIFLDLGVSQTQWFGIVVVIVGVAATLLLGKRAAAT